MKKTELCRAESFVKKAELEAEMTEIKDRPTGSTGCVLNFVDQIWLLVAYPKSERDDLSHDEIKQLKNLVEDFDL